MANRVPSGPEGVPFLGSSLQYADDPLGFMERVAREYGDVARLDVYGQEVYQVTDPDAIRRVLVTNAANYRKPTLGGDEGLGGLLGDGLLTSDGDHWQRQRKVMQPSFYGAKLERVRRYHRPRYDRISRLVHRRRAHEHPRRDVATHPQNRGREPARFTNRRDGARHPGSPHRSRPALPTRAAGPRPRGGADAAKRALSPRRGETGQNPP